MFRRIGVITLGITFITVGTIFLLNYFFAFSIIPALQIAGPSIYIIFGLECIVSYALATKHKDEQSMKISFGSIFVILLLCSCIGLLANNLIYFDVDDGLTVKKTFKVIVESIDY